jgi:hypothetical protein
MTLPFAENENGLAINKMLASAKHLLFKFEYALFFLFFIIFISWWKCMALRLHSGYFACY